MSIRSSYPSDLTREDTWRRVLDFDDAAKDKFLVLSILIHFVSPLNCRICLYLGSLIVQDKPVNLECERLAMHVSIGRIREISAVHFMQWPISEMLMLILIVRYGKIMRHEWPKHGSAGGQQRATRTRRGKGLSLWHLRGYVVLTL